MAKVRLHAPLRFNLTGWDREPLELPAGEQEVPEAVAAFLRSHPHVGEVLEGRAPSRRQATRSRTGRAQGADTRKETPEAEEEA